jgi:hypothetical protein
MIAFLVGVLVAVVPGFSGKTSSRPFGGLLFTVIAAACFTNLYGEAWFLVVGPAGLLGWGCP